MRKMNIEKTFRDSEVLILGIGQNHKFRNLGKFHFFLLSHIVKSFLLEPSAYIFDLTPPFNKNSRLLIHKSVHDLPPSVYFDPLVIRHLRVFHFPDLWLITNWELPANIYLQCASSVRTDYNQFHTILRLFDVLLNFSLEHECQTWATQMQHERDSSDTSPTWVRHEWHERNTSATRVPHKWRECDTSEKVWFW